MSKYVSLSGVFPDRMEASFFVRRSAFSAVPLSGKNSGEVCYLFVPEENIRARFGKKPGAKAARTLIEEGAEYFCAAGGDEVEELGDGVLEEMSVLLDQRGYALNPGDAFHLYVPETGELLVSIVKT